MPGARTKRSMRRLRSVPATSELLPPLLFARRRPLLAYHVAALSGCDVDRPGNLAKSVKVE